MCGQRLSSTRLDKTKLNHGFQLVVLNFLIVGCKTEALMDQSNFVVCFIPVKEKLHHDPDSEIATTSLRVSLMCPVSIII